MELTVISGKGGTGKTMIAMALSRLGEQVTLADCDVDAPNLYLYHDGKDIRKSYFYAGKKAVVSERFCTDCKKCEAICRFDAIKDRIVDKYRCKGCGACVLVCPEEAISMRDQKSADVYLTQLEKGYISRAEMEIGSDGSGKLVTVLRNKARRISETGALIIIDGSPGIGCPVISSVTASDIVLIVTEPTQSGFEDFARVAELCAHFGILTLACINKCDINPDISEAIARYCTQNGIVLVGRIPYDDTVMESINALRPITDYSSPAGAAVRQMWENMQPYIMEIQKNQQEEEDDVV